MRQALATARTRSGRALVVAGSWIASERQELGVLVGMCLLVAGLLMYRVPGVALIVVGAIWLWIHLPTRQPFIERPPAEKGKG